MIMQTHKPPYNQISVSKGNPERISQCSERHIQSVLENHQVFLKMARELALAVKSDGDEAHLNNLANELLIWLEE